MPSTQSLVQTIQDVKHHLYARDFASAFDTQEKREAYALRWSVTRAAGYAAVFSNYDCLASVVGPKQRAWKGNGKADGGSASGRVNGESEVEEGEQQQGGTSSSTTDAQRALGKIISIGGGGGAELVGMAVAVSAQRPHPPSSNSEQQHPDQEQEQEEQGQPGLHLHVLDRAPWSSISTSLLSALHSHLPALATNTTTATNTTNFNTSFQQSDVLDLSPQAIKTTFADASMVTIMFTLNELYSASMARTTALLLALRDVMDEGAVLVVVDSPGSYASVRLGGNGKGKGGQQADGKAKGDEGAGGGEKRYPMKWLLDHTLLELAERDEAGGGKGEERWERSDHGGSKGGGGGRRRRKWDKVVDEESRWFRWERKGLKYPAGLELEDMRFQLHVYRRV